MLKKILLGLLVIAIGTFSFFYFGVYSEGYRAGTIVKISTKGILFKTIEGQLNVETFGAVRDQNNFSQTFQFSVDSDRQDIFDALKEASLSGERVNLKYEERYLKYFWDGDTKYFVVEVERADDANKKETPTKKKQKTPLFE